MCLRHLAAVVLLLGLISPAPAGLYYSGEVFAELPSQWRGFLIDQRALRTIGGISPNGPASPLRQDYLDTVARLEKTAKDRKLSADELADLGALHVRLGQIDRAIVLLRAAQREHPSHFRINANLGTAWQLRGDLDQAALCLEQSVQLVPGKHQKAEEYHLKLVRLRIKQPKDSQVLDDLFDVRYLDDQGKYSPGKLSAADVKKLPGNAAAIVQQLALWLPADGQLLWQLAELANAHGDVKTAAAMFDGCVTEFGMSNPELRRRRQLTRSLADQIEARPAGKAEHEGHAGAFKAKSRRPLLGRIDLAELPPIDARGINALPWALLGETVVDKDFKPAFPKYLKELDGKQVSLSGFMQPLREEAEMTAFMFIEYPVGCWYCEVPEITGIVLVELAPGESISYTRNLVRVVGRLTLNGTDPENFMFTIGRARVAPAD
jgi:hypothetical protein